MSLTPGVVFFCLFVSRPQPRHMEVPRLGVKSVLQLLAYATATPDTSRIYDLHHSSWEHQILNPRSEARDPTPILMDTSQVHFH